MIDYEAAKREGPKLKAMLTRAVKTGDYNTVKGACLRATQAWYLWGAWPDNWSMWQRALDDAALQHNLTHYTFMSNTPQVIAPRLEEL